MKHLFFILLFVLSHLSTTAFGAEKIIVGSTHFPPLYNVEDGKKPAGTLIDMAEKLLGETDYEYELRGYPPKRLYKNIVDGKVDIWIGPKETPVYKDHIISSSSPVLYLQVQVFSIEPTKTVTAKEDLIGKKVITIRGYGYNGLISYIKNPENKITYLQTNTHEASFKMLEKKRAKYLLNYKLPADKFLKTHNYKGLKSKTISKYPIFLNISKKTEKADKLLQELVDVYERLKKENAF